MSIAPYTLSRLQDDVNKRIIDESGGTVTSGIITSYANEALRLVRRKWDIPSSKFISQLIVYQDVTTYAIPDGYKTFGALMLQEQINDPLSVRYVREDDFWRNFPINCVIVSDRRNGTDRSLLVNLNGALRLDSYLLNSCDTYNGNGTWTANTATSDAANVATDTLFYREGSGSVRFDIVVGQSGNDYAEIYNSTMTAVDMNNPSVKDIGTFFVWVYLPSATNYTSFTARWGSSTSDYYENTVTTQFSGNAFVQGWNLLGFDWTSATTTGTPNDQAIDYSLFRATYPSGFSSQTGLRVDWFVMREKRITDLHYYSDNLVIDGSTSLPKDTFESATDTSSYLNVDPAFVDWILYDTMESIYTNAIVSPGGQAFYAGRKADCENDICRRFPTLSTGQITNYMESPELQPRIN